MLRIGWSCVLLSLCLWQVAICSTPGAGSEVPHSVWWSELGNERFPWYEEFSLHPWSPSQFSHYKSVNLDKKSESKFDHF